MNAVPALPIVPDAAVAPLPVVYEAAQKALAECSKVDECKNWADKAAALASYARQAKDDSLRVMATRIQNRAMRRAGELLKLVPRADESTRYGKDGTVPPVNRGQEGILPPVTRTQAAEQAGLSERQRKTALRIAEVPQEEFESALSASQPPTVTEMAARGVVSRPQVYVPDEIKPAPIGQAVKAQSLLRELAALCGTTEPAAVARACVSLDIDAIRGYVETIDAWLDRFVVISCGRRRPGSVLMDTKTVDLNNSADIDTVDGSRAMADPPLTRTADAALKRREAARAQKVPGTEPTRAAICCI